jgi:RimJ/RimL family protein N-acetyltransferase
MTVSFGQGQAVRLRAVEAQDWQFFFTWSADTYFERYTDSIAFPRSREAAKKWAADLATSDPRNDVYRWVIENLDGECVGTINTHTCDPRNGTFQYGVAICREHWRKGYASNAIRLVLSFFFHELRYQKANVHIYDFNTGSVALHCKLGFQHEGRLRRMGFTEGAYFDWVLMGITRDEFTASQGTGPLSKTTTSSISHAK